MFSDIGLCFLKKEGNLKGQINLLSIELMKDKPVSTLKLKDLQGNGEIYHIHGFKSIALMSVFPFDLYVSISQSRTL
jgi:hypothetical protein